jgi:REP element-mobilizing transposase RayT
MTVARRVVPGRTQLVTRRVIGRTHLLRPDSKLIGLCVYLLGIYCERYGILLHAVVFMSNHVHLVLTDQFGCIPDFLRDFHRAVALGVKVLRRWQGAVWDGKPTSRVELCTPQAVIEKLAYVMANPVNAGLVRHADEWPGITTLPQDLGVKSWTAQRPEFFFDPDNPLWPETATLHLSAPELPWDIDEVRHRVERELERLHSEANRRLAVKGSDVPGPLLVLQGSAYKRTATRERERTLNPSIAVGRGQLQNLLDAIRILKSFRRAYREALTKWREGFRDTVFPAATWLMRWLHGAQVAPS